MGDVVTLKVTHAAGQFAGGPIANFTGGWALIPFVGRKPHFWTECTESARKVIPDMPEDARAWRALCGPIGMTHSRVPPLGAGDFGMCKRCLAKAPRWLTKEDRQSLMETDPRVRELFR